MGRKIMSKRLTAMMLSLSVGIGMNLSNVSANESENMSVSALNDVNGN